jgi:hypothetical protein
MPGCTRDDVKKIGIRKVDLLYYVIDRNGKKRRVERG